MDNSQQPFTTNNAILAYCLHMAGVPWENDNQAARVFYNADVLNRFTNSKGEPYYRGWELEKAVAHAHKSGRRGHVEYVFKATPRVPKLLQAFKEEVDYLDKGEGYAHERVRDLVATMELEPDVSAVRLACVFLKMRAQFMDIWKCQVPIVIIDNPGRVRHSRGMIETKDGVREAMVVETPGFKAMSLNASKETREHLGL